MSSISIKYLGHDLSWKRAMDLQAIQVFIQIVWVLEWNGSLWEWTPPTHREPWCDRPNSPAAVPIDPIPYWHFSCQTEERKRTTFPFQFKVALLPLRRRCVIDNVVFPAHYQPTAIRQIVGLIYSYIWTTLALGLRTWHGGEQKSKAKRVEWEGVL